MITRSAYPSMIAASVGPGRPHRPVGGLAGAEGRAALERAEEDVGHRAAHRPGHQQGEERTGGTDEGAGHQQQRVGQDVAARGDGQPGERVEQRDHDRDVGAADRQHQQHAEAEPDQRQHDPDPHRRVGDEQPGEHRARPAASPPKTTGSPGKTTGREVIRSCSLAKVTTDPANETEPTTIVNAVATRTNQPTSIRRRRRRSRRARAAPPGRPPRRRRR